ncbi:flagellar basal body P-ring formation protein FlgA [Serratia marcescens]|uniref:flagellar basal body P-ring formation chaperone FlgA n=1 Tax=Serratia marcescens TaxID=615 RepID=UPI001865F4C0|nr:flagellar basal body P-ring formation chaperone FlgA [Serratia marcescens]MBN5272607.1 flagellar basal body P-ring formation protein FlgA [Serratia marcescens]MBN5277714.1 flagellar basal body P-ring formation protein FlgA [Serratia marcescens]MBN5305854.1 flagellar basal body P-ring formation protein FlgA [Serratia marcescens]MBN5362166.1 flagellar basal body P-ring formation protein FlgA [Serratia marcescens]MBN5420691.1 flagellar basal body P-ring formation protein FlgA [Serratia marcesc
MKGKMLLIGLLCSLNARADDLATQIESFIQGKFSGEPVQVKVRVRTPPAQWPACELPQLSLPPNARIAGNVSISARCGQERRFIQTQVQVFGRYLVSARGISAGSRLTAADLTLKEGRLDTLPPRALTEAGKALGAVSLRNISPGQPLTLAMLRRAWIIKAGQSVQVSAQGEGFNISGSGKAMNNAAAEDSVRVRMASGQIVSGVVGDDGAIRITL